MKKGILIFCTVLAILSLTACGHLNGNDVETDQLEPSISKDLASNTQTIESVKKKVFTDFIYDVGPRFGPIKKADVDKARTFEAFLDEEQLEKIVYLKSVNIIRVIDDKESGIREIGYSDKLTDAQLELLQSFDYSTNFLIRAEYQQKNEAINKLENSYATPYLTIVPEKQATYVSGKSALKEFLKANSQDVRANVERDKLQPAKLFFTVTKNGAIENVKLDRTSGYPLLDKTMIELITKAPGEWEPAKNTKGEKVNQELVVSFGLMGC